MSKKLPSRTRDNKSKDTYSLRDYMETFIVSEGVSAAQELSDRIICANKKNRWFCKVVRDLTVQRKGVWTSAMMMEYFADCAMGNTDNNPLHYMELKSALKHAEKMGAWDFAKHIKKFIDKGYSHAHIDGGNRSDSVYLTLTNKLPVAKGVYDYGFDENNNKIYFRLEKDTMFEDLEEDFKDAILDYSGLEIVEYYDLTRSKRKSLFRKLNDGIDLNAPEIRNCEETDVCEINRNHDIKYDKLYLNTKVLTETGIARWNLSEYVAKMKSGKRNLSYDENGKLLVAWPSSTTVDKDYLVGSDADRYAEDEEKFYVDNFISYLDILKDDKFALFEKGLYIDFFLLMSWMKNNNIDMTYPVTKVKKLNLLKLFNDKHTNEWNAETDKPWISKYSKKKPVMVEWSGLYTKNNDEVLTQRLNRWVDEFITELLDKEVLVKVTNRTSSDKHEVSKLLKKQKSKTKISGKKVNTLKIAAEPSYVNVDHIEDLRGGGPDTFKNKSLEFGKDNRSKGAVRH
tara:strand:+ start:157 stop:1692 length:1536 start_codon:yes stop_codon:yes gene_type:complete